MAAFGARHCKFVACLDAGGGFERPAEGLLVRIARDVAGGGGVREVFRDQALALAKMAQIRPQHREERRIRKIHNAPFEGKGLLLWLISS